MTQQPLAFMSYARFNDEHDYGRLTWFRKRLSNEVQAYTGEEFPIFQDRDITWGQHWKQRIEEALGGVTFLIPILTPSFFQRPECRREVKRFFEHERHLNRTDLILPVYYIDHPRLNDETWRARNLSAQIIATRQYADWRELRFEPLDSPKMAQTLAHLAVQIRDALERTNHIRSSHPSDNRTLQPDSASPHSREGYWLGSLKPPSDSQGQEPPWWEQPLINRSSVENSTQPIHLALRGRKIGQSEKQAFEMPSDFSQRCNHLASLLGAEKWKEADQETAGIFRGIAQQQNPVWLRTIDIKKLPCQAFRVLDEYGQHIAMRSSALVCKGKSGVLLAVDLQSLMLQTSESLEKV